MATFQKVKEQNFLELCADGTYEEIEKSINSGININAVDMGGYDALSNAARYNKDVKVMKLLLKNGASINHNGNDGSTPLMFAASDNSLEAVKFLLEAGADIKAARDDGITALMGAAKKNTSEVVKFLLKAGANVNIKDTNGMTPLLYAAMNNPDPEVINALIDAGADDTKSNNGDNAFILAARWNVPEVVEILIKAGANMTTINNYGKSAFDYAFENKKLEGSEVLKYLKEVLNETKNS